MTAISAVRSIQNRGRNVYGRSIDPYTFRPQFRIKVLQTNFLYTICCVFILTFKMRCRTIWVHFVLSTYKIIVIKNHNIHIYISLLDPQTTFLFETFVPLGKFCFVYLCIMFYVVLFCWVIKFEVILEKGWCN